MHDGNKALFPIISFFATVLLTVAGSAFLHLDDKQQFVVFATGASVSLALTLIEQRIQSDIQALRSQLSDEIRRSLELYRLCKDINDPQLEDEVISLARRLSAGEVPPYIAAVRVPQLYERAHRRVYASYVSRTAEDLTRWATNARFKSIVDVSGQRGRSAGVKFIRTFVMTRAQILLPDGSWKPECAQVVCAQFDAGIEVRVIWLEDLQQDAVAPTRRLDRNFTVFDNVEAVETTDYQTIYRAPAKRLQELIDLSVEQIKYSDLVPRPALGDPGAGGPARITGPAREPSLQSIGGNSVGG